MLLRNIINLPIVQHKTIKTNLPADAMVNLIMSILTNQVIVYVLYEIFLSVDISEKYCDTKLSLSKNPGYLFHARLANTMLLFTKQNAVV